MKTLHLFLIWVICFISPLTLAQTQTTNEFKRLKAKEGQVIAYYTKEGARIYTEPRSYYYRKLLKVNDDNYIIQDFYTELDKKQIDPITLTHIKDLYRWMPTSADGRLTHWYKTGQKYSQTFYIKGKQEGTLTSWYENGVKSHEAFFRNDKHEGEEKTWYKSGQLRTQTYYENGLENGEIRQWYKNGQQKFLGLMINGKLEGYAKTWYDNGVLETESFYKNDQLDGIQKKWDKKGRLLYQRKYQQDHVLWPQKQS